MGSHSGHTQRGGGPSGRGPSSASIGSRWTRTRAPGPAATRGGTACGAAGRCRPRPRRAGRGPGPELMTSSSRSAKPPPAAWTIRADRPGRPPLAAAVGPLTQCQPRTGVARCSRPSAGCAGAVACQQLIEAPSSRSGYDCLVEGSRGEAGGSLRLAAALIPSSLDALVRGQSGVVRARAGSRVTAGLFAGHSGDARPLAVFV